MISSLAGKYDVVLADGTTHHMQLPGTLDTNQIGSPDLGLGQWNNSADLFKSENKDKIQIGTRFTRKYTYTGLAKISRQINFKIEKDQRAFVEVQRSRCLGLMLDQQKVEPYIPQSLSTKSVFEVSQWINQATTLTFLSDNSYPNLPANDIIYSSTSTDETQTNWNGLLVTLFLE